MTRRSKSYKAESVIGQNSIASLPVRQFLDSNMLIYHRGKQYRRCIHPPLSTTRGSVELTIHGAVAGRVVIAGSSTVESGTIGEGPRRIRTSVYVGEQGVRVCEVSIDAHDGSIGSN